MSKEDKLDILSMVEASPVKKNKAIKLFGMAPVKYFRWQLKYYLDNCLDDKRGRYPRGRMRLEDMYRQQIIDVRKTGVFGKYVIGPETIMGKLEDEGIFLSHETIRKVLHQEGLIEPRAKAPRHEYKRFEAEYANSLWQMDILHAFILGYGYYYLFHIIDDYSRKLMHWDMFPVATGKEAIEVLETAMTINKVRPDRLLTDRGTQFYSGDGNRYGEFDSFLDKGNIEHVLARVKHPQTLGKVERYHRTLRQLCLNLNNYYDPIDLRRAVKVFVEEYNYRRKHKAIGRVTPQQKYAGEDREIIRKRDALRRQIIQQRRRLHFSDQQLEKELVCQEVVDLLKNSYTKGVVLV